MELNERLRFAPSPTGDLHVGGARAALYCWLYARKTNGKFLLRIEDTDVERSSEEALHSILGSLKWLGLDWDEEPVFQSKRSDLYRKAVAKLLETGAAYRCFCTKEELETERERAKTEKLPYVYSGKCRCIENAEFEEMLAKGVEYTVRFLVPEGETSWHDLVHETTTFQNSTIGDFIIARADGSPVYILGVAVDDADMRITLVMRGDDHLSNTPKQMMLMRALGSDTPRYAHLPQVLGADKKKLSKRHGAASVLNYKEMGFLPEAVVNFLALIGWSPGDDREKMTLPELIEAFSIEGLSKKSGVFDIQKLEWLNGRYLNELPPDELLNRAAPFLVESGLINEGDMIAQRTRLQHILDLLKERCRTLADFPVLGDYFFRTPEAYEEKGVLKHFSDISTAEVLEKLAEKYASLEEFNLAATETALRELGEELNMGGAKLIHPTRLAVTGKTFGPGLFDILETVGKEETVERLKKAALFIRNQQAGE